MDHIYAAAEKIVENAVKAIARGDWDTLGELMNINHGLLSAIGVSIKDIEELVYLARTHGALGAKLTGAGMGGSIIILAPKEKVNGIVNAIRGRAKHVLPTNIDCRGVVVEESSN